MSKTHGQPMTKAAEKEHRYYHSSNSMHNSIQTLFANIQFNSVDKPIRTVVITSSVPYEGKTTTVANLGEVIAAAGYSVLLVECDMRRRSLAGMLDAHATVGLYSVLTGKASLRQAAVSVGTPGLFLLDAEPGIPNPTNILNSVAIDELIEEAQNSYDYVIFDTPPIGTFVDGAMLAGKVDATVLVVRCNFVKRDAVELTKTQLDNAGANTIGVCATFADTGKSEYYYYYYYGKQGQKQQRKRKRKQGMFK